MKEDIPYEHQRIIEELKRRTINDLPPKLLQDETLFHRFAKARDFHIDAAESMLRKHIDWRKDYGIEDIHDYKAPEVFLKYLPAKFRCFDKKGSVIRYLEFGGADLKGVVQSAKMYDCLKYFFQLCEEDMEIINKQNKKLGKNLTKVTYIYDFGGLSFSTATDLKVIKVCIQSAQLFQDNYPERIEAILAINVSPYVTMLFAVIKPLLAEAVVQKMKFFGVDGWKEELLEVADADELPAFLGGRRTDPDGNPLCKTFVLHGEKVPYRYYLQKSSKQMAELKDVEKLIIGRASKKELDYEVNKPGSILEWEFETKTKDIGFTVFFRNKSSNESSAKELIPKQRLDSCYEPEKGIYRCEEAGIYTLVFDNSFSWMRQKEIYFKVRIQNPEKIEEASNQSSLEIDNDI